MRPDDYDPCAQCGHAFGSHYLTWSGVGMGCHEQRGVRPRSNTPSCECHGFMVLWTPQIGNMRAIQGSITVVEPAEAARQ